MIASDRVARLALGAVCALLVVLPVNAVAAPPPNDNFASATVLPGPLPVSVVGTTIDATAETNEPEHPLNAGGASAWWRWTSTVTGNVTIQTCSSDFDTLLAVYTGATFVPPLTRVASSDDSCGGVNMFRSRVTIAATSGTTYQIVVDGFAFEGELPDTGAVALNLTEIGAAANDNFANATVLTGMSATGTGTNIGSSREVGEPVHVAPGILGGVSSWWRWTAPASGTATLDTCGSSFITLTGVYTGATLAALTDVVISEDLRFCTDQGSQVVFGAAAGETYQIAIDGFERATGSIALNLALPTPPPPPPVVDTQPPPAVVQPPPVVVQPPPQPQPPPPPAQPGCSGAGNVILGTAGNDTRDGTAARDIIFGLAGNDKLNGLAGNDCLYGELGNDNLSGGNGADRLFGGAGGDRLTGGSGNDRLSGEAGADTLTGGTGTDSFSGGSGGDRISARDRRRETITCGAGRDVVTADRVDRVARDCERVSRR